MPAFDQSPSKELRISRFIPRDKALSSSRLVEVVTVAVELGRSERRKVTNTVQTAPSLPSRQVSQFDMKQRFSSLDVKV